MKLIINSGRLYHVYDGSQSPQDVVADITADGIVHVHYNPEIGNAIPSDVYHGLAHRIGLSIYTKKEVRAWYSRNKNNLSILINGMGKKWDGNNTVGTLTDKAQTVLDDLDDMEYQASAGEC